MLPVCYPSSPSPTTGLPEAVAYALSSVSGLTRWVDYIPVKLVGSPLGMNEQTTNLNGFVPMRLLGSAIGMNAWRDYIPVYVDNSATEAWVTSATGYIPYANSVSGVTTPSFYFNFSNPQNVTLGAAQARGTITSTQNAVIAASVSPSRTTGVAPLYVNFDATGTTSTLSTNPSHELFFATDFGDYSAGTWANGVQSSGLTSKNAGYGPVTGHVYETPGTYTVQMVVTDGVNTAVKTGTIVVQDPNTVYAGTDTICISHSNNFTGAPSGATKVNTAGNTDMYAAWTGIATKSNKRILFCKADSWVSSASINLGGLTGTTVGGYGTGSAHTFASGTLVSVTPAMGATPVFQASSSTDCRVCNFKIAAMATHVGVAANTAGTTQFTVNKVEVRGATGGISITADGNQSAFTIHDQVCVYECLVDQVYGYAGVPADTPRVSGATASNGGGVTACVFTSVGHPFKRFNRVQLFGTAPAGLSTGVDYYISASNLTANTFSISSTFSTDTPLTSTGMGTCDVTAIGLSGGIGAFIAMTRGCFMGNYIDSCNYGEQVLRIPFINKAHVNNNYLARPNQTKNVVKIHCRGYDDIYPFTSGYTEKLVFSANFMDLRGGYSYGDVIPNNGRTATAIADCGILYGAGGPSPGLEHCRNGIFENNFTQSCLGDTKDNRYFITVGCSNVTVRNNIFDASFGDRTTQFTTSWAYFNFHFANVNSSTTEQTVGVRIYNNTRYSNIYNAEAAHFVNVTPPGAYPNVDKLTIQNNIWYDPYQLPAYPLVKVALKISAGATPTNYTTTNNTDSSGRTSLISPNFVVQPPVALTDWRPNTGSYAIDSGATVPVLRDFNNASRYGATYDLGAVLP